MTPEALSELEKRLRIVQSIDIEHKGSTGYLNQLARLGEFFAENGGEELIAAVRELADHEEALGRAEHKVVHLHQRLKDAAVTCLHWSKLFDSTAEAYQELYTWARGANELMLQMDAAGLMTLTGKPVTKEAP